MEGRANFLAVWLPGGKVCSYNILFTDTSSSIEQIYLAHLTALCGGMNCAKLFVLPVRLKCMTESTCGTSSSVGVGS